MGAERAWINTPRFLSQQRITGHAGSPARSPFSRSTDGIRSRPFFMGAERARINTPRFLSQQRIAGRAGFPTRSPFGRSTDGIRFPSVFSWALSAPGQTSHASYHNSASLDAPFPRRAAPSAVQRTGFASRPFFMGAERARPNSPHLPLTPAPAASARRTARRRRIPESYRNAPRANAACRRAHPARRGRNSNAVRR